MTTSAPRGSVEAAPGTRSATGVTVSTFGALAGLAGIEHGIGEVLQGNVAPDGVMIESWPDSEVFDILSGEPAMTLVPNLLLTGILATLVSLGFLVWVSMFAHTKNGGLVLILLSVVMLLVGGGFGPPLLGVMVGAAATRINSPPRWWRTHLSGGSRRSLAKSWPWFLGTGVFAWLALMPGTILLDLFFGVSDLEFMVPAITFLVLSAFGLLLLTIFSGFARDALRRSVASSEPAVSG